MEHENPSVVLIDPTTHGNSFGKTRIIIEPSFDRVGNYLKRLYAGTCSVPALRLSRMYKSMY